MDRRASEERAGLTTQIVYADDSWDEDLVRSVLAGTLKSVGRKTTGYKARRT